MGRYRASISSTASYAKTILVPPTARTGNGTVQRAAANNSAIAKSVTTAAPLQPVVTRKKSTCTEVRFGVGIQSDVELLNLRKC
jgi:hypothetical protein